ncbi:axonemal dynein light chain domain-containing protein 1 isoform X1 [Carcharodon carcharias]|uniref:axonemal dynein light chain domain-containing protein 1 isoform X1 n=2 Tax=Carcharodon carcharias TaxID=13397 RepID=UPI001B7EBEDF|nr:axonemal dynein light chain domain-containing protein 1 isoform X1 [Carcharodon carcharias]
MCDAVSDDVRPDEDSNKLTSTVCEYLKDQLESTPTSEQMLDICVCFGDGAKSGEIDKLDCDIFMHLKEQTELPKLKDKPQAIEQHPPSSLQNDFIPEEILLALTTMTNSCCRDEPLGPLVKNKTRKDFKLHHTQPTDRVWHHPTRRTKFKYLIDQPVSVARAGRDISFLCDAVYSKCSEQSVPPVSTTMDKSAVRAQLVKQPVVKQFEIPESLIPDDYHIVKNWGVLGLEYYEDKYTTLLQDHEKKLRVFPSMKPSGRVEAIQLSQVMDAMLEKVGFNEDTEQQFKGETQMHHLLDLVKKEQDIYNIVFHELIRQVSVDCAERGELLAKIRDRYVNLLDYIPRHLNSMHNEIMMQRVLDRQLIVELFVFQNAVEKLNSELGELRERDHKVAKTIQKTQMELTDALLDAQKNANMLDEYHQLYELQRKRLIAQVNALTQEKDWWNEAAYSLALKVIEEQNLKLVHDLQVSEKLWVKISQHFAALLGTKDAEDQTELQQITEHWRRRMTKFTKNLDDAENSSREKRELILSGFKKWHKYFSEKIVSPLGMKSVPKDMLYKLRNDLKDWHEMITQDYARYEGSSFLTTQEVLLDIVQLQNNWTDLGLTLFERHRWSTHEKMPEEIAMQELNSTVMALSQIYTIRLTGENGTAWYIMKLQDMLESCRVKFDYANMEDIGLVEFDLLKLNEQFPTLINLLEDAMSLAATLQTEEERQNKRPYVSLQLGDVIQKMQDWLMALFKMITHMDTKLTQQILIVQGAMSHLLVDLLLQMVHDPIANINKKHFTHLPYPDTPAKLEEKALMVASQLNILSTQLYSWCRDIIEAFVKQRTALHFEDSDNELKELEKLKVESNEWINICEMLLSEIKQQPVQLLSPRSEDVQSQINLTRDLCAACLRGSATEILGATDSELSVLLPGEKESAVGAMTTESFQRLSTMDDTETRDQSGLEEGQALQSQSKSTLKFIGDDTNIHERNLRETATPVPKVGIDAVAPKHPKSVKAFKQLTAIGMLQQQLVETEQRAMNAEERASFLDEKLHEALDKINDLTLDLKTEESKNQHPEPAKKYFEH